LRSGSERGSTSVALLPSHNLVEVQILSTPSQESRDEEIEEDAEAVEGQGEEVEEPEEIVETHQGMLKGDGVFVGDPGSLLELGYGFPEDGGAWLPDVAALHLLRRGILEVWDGERQIDFQDLFRRGLSSDPSFFLKYLVYRDMRSKGRKIRAGSREAPYLWFYEKPSRPSSHLVGVYSRNQIISLEELERLLALGGRFKKGVYLALVDEEGEVSYYEIKRFTTKQSALSRAERTDLAQVVGPMAVVWDPLAAVSLYREGYFGKPIGIRKPKSMDFERPITLSFTESLYLAERGRIRLEDLEGPVSSEQLFKTASAEPNFKERLLVYTVLKDAGLIVKSGMKFGVDFAVYEYGPGIDHAPFLIHVYEKGSGITPTEIVRAGRLAASVKKKFIIAQADPAGGKVTMLSFARVKP